MSLRFAQGHTPETLDAQFPLVNGGWEPLMRLQSTFL